MTSENPATLGLVLAGGLARRMGGGHKGLREIGGETVLRRLTGRLAPQVRELALNVNADRALFAGFGLPLLPDELPGHPGPLAGVLAGLEWAARERPDLRWLLSVPSDAPFIPDDLCRRLHEECRARHAELAAAASGGRTHPVIGLWPVSLGPALRHALVDEGIHKIDRFTARFRLAVVSWPAEPRDPFFNVNTPADLAEAERLLSASAR